MSAKKIRQLRLRLGLTQREFAERLGVGTASIYRWERGKTSPSPLSKRQIEEFAAAA